MITIKLDLNKVEKIGKVTLNKVSINNKNSDSSKEEKSFQDVLEDEIKKYTKKKQKKGR